METPIGLLPTRESLDTSGLNLTDQQLDLLLSVDTAVWKEEASLIPEGYQKFGDRLPQALWREYDALLERLDRAEHGAETASAGARGGVSGREPAFGGQPGVYASRSDT